MWISLIFLFYKWADEGYTSRNHQNEIPTLQGMSDYISCFLLWWHTDSHCFPSRALEILEVSTHVHHPPSPGLPEDSLSRINILRLSSPEYMISTSPSLGANTGDSPVPTFHLLDAPLQGGAHNPTHAVQRTMGLLSISKMEWSFCWFTFYV